MPIPVVILLLVSGIQTLVLLSYWRHRRRLSPALLKAATPSSAPVTLIFTAKDEEADIRSSLDAFERLDHPHLHILAVDDRSVDRTGEILAGHVSRHHYRCIRLTELPAGWLGKTHALYRAAQFADTEWLLFTDADVVLAPDSVARALGYAQAHGLDFLSLAPHLSPGSSLARLTLEFFNAFFVLFMRPWMSGEKKGRAIGVGAFNLVRRGAYVKAGGHEAVRLRVDDDLALAENVKASGGTLASLNGTMHIQLEFYRDFRALATGFEKNVIQAFNFSLLKALFGICAVYSLLVAPLALSFFSDWGLGFLALQGGTFASINRQFGYPAWRAWCFPVGLHLYVGVMLRSCVLAKVRGEIRWRGVRVSLKDMAAFRSSG